MIKRLGFLIGMALLSMGIGAQEPEPLIGDVNGGSRSVPVHRIPLLDEDGQEISPDDDPLLPFSIRQTCALKCHNYGVITSGWHFNAGANDIPSGRPGHPWIWVDTSTGIQIPLSYRAWPGTHKPDALGVTPWEFSRRFGRQFPGGGVAEFEPTANPGKTMRILVSGKLEANCLACHDADPAHDQGEAAIQIGRENFRWAAASTSGLASVNGSAQKMPDTYDYMMPEPPDDPKIVPPGIEYRAGIFDSKKQVFFSIVRRIPRERCYYCHSTLDLELHRTEPWRADEDVHLAAGLECVDCHRNGLDHNIVRGYPGESEISSNPLAEVSSCEGCHLGDISQEKPGHGRLGAPVPKHRGIPPVHFKKLSCTACHSGPWPEAGAHRVKTSIAHGLGLHNADKSEEALPQIFSPVFAQGMDGKIAPHYLVWPSFWGILEGDSITPVPLERIRQIAAPWIAQAQTAQASGWLPLSEDTIASWLAALQGEETSPGKAVYIGGGQVYQLADEKLTAIRNKAAEPCLWPMAHDVRPAAQSLGAKGCTDCHSMDAPFFFGTVAIESPLALSPPPMYMVDFQNLDAMQVKTLALSFHFRPWFKIVTLISAGILIAVLLVFALRGLSIVLDYIGKQISGE